MINGLKEALQKAETLADKIYYILVYEGQYNRKFHLGEIIMNNPAEVRDLVMKYDDYLIAHADCGEYVVEQELVRCKNCEYYRNNPVAPCKKVMRSEDADENWYCADAKRKQ